MCSSLVVWLQGCNTHPYIKESPLKILSFSKTSKFKISQFHLISATLEKEKLCSSLPLDSKRLVLSTPTIQWKEKLFRRYQQVWRNRFYTRWMKWIRGCSETHISCEGHPSRVDRLGGIYQDTGSVNQPPKERYRHNSKVISHCFYCAKDLYMVSYQKNICRKIRQIPLFWGAWKR